MNWLKKNWVEALFVAFVAIVLLMIVTGFSGIITSIENFLKNLFGGGTQAPAAPPIDQATPYSQQTYAQGVADGTIGPNGEW